MLKTNSKGKIFTLFIAIFSFFIVVITLLSVIFPALIISNIGIQSNDLEQFEIGNDGFIILLCNIVIVSLGIAYYKNKLPSQFQKGLSNLLQKQLSKKITIIILVVILLPYIVLSSPELLIDEGSQAPDYQIFLAAKNIFPFGKTTFTEAAEQNDRYVRMILLITSLEIFQNVKIIPFLGSRNFFPVYKVFDGFPY